MIQKALKVFIFLMLSMVPVFSVTAKKVAHWLRLDLSSLESAHLPTLKVLNDFITDCYLKGEVPIEKVYLHKEEGLVDFSCVGDAMDELPSDAEVLASLAKEPPWELIDLR